MMYFAIFVTTLEYAYYHQLLGLCLMLHLAKFQFYAFEEFHYISVENDSWP